MKRSMVVLSVLLTTSLNLIVVYQLFSRDEYYPATCCWILPFDRLQCEIPEEGPVTCCPIDQCPKNTTYAMLGNCFDEDAVNSECYVNGQWRTKMYCPSCETNPV